MATYHYSMYGHNLPPSGLYPTWSVNDEVDRWLEARSAELRSAFNVAMWSLGESDMPTRYRRHTLSFPFRSRNQSSYVALTNDDHQYRDTSRQRKCRSEIKVFSHARVISGNAFNFSPEELRKPPQILLDKKEAFYRSLETGRSFSLLQQSRTVEERVFTPVGLYGAVSKLEEESNHGDMEVPATLAQQTEVLEVPNSSHTSTSNPFKSQTQNKIECSKSSRSTSPSCSSIISIDQEVLMNEEAQETHRHIINNLSPPDAYSATDAVAGSSQTIHVPTTSSSIYSSMFSTSTASSTISTRDVTQTLPNDNRKSVSIQMDDLPPTPPAILRFRASNPILKLFNSATYRPSSSSENITRPLTSYPSSSLSGSQPLLHGASNKLRKCPPLESSSTLTTPINEPPSAELAHHRRRSFLARLFTRALVPAKSVSGIPTNEAQDKQLSPMKRMSLHPQLASMAYTTPNVAHGEGLVPYEKGLKEWDESLLECDKAVGRGDDGKALYENHNIGVDALAAYGNFKSAEELNVQAEEDDGDEEVDVMEAALGTKPTQAVRKGWGCEKAGVVFDRSTRGNIEISKCSAKDGSVGDVKGGNQVCKKKKKFLLRPRP